MREKRVDETEAASSEQADEEGVPRSWVLVLDEGEEAIAELTEFARRHRLRGSHFTAIGAFSGATLGFFDMAAKDYERIEVGEQTEVLSLTGNVAVSAGEPKLHAHVVLGRRDGSALGGHLLAGRVRPTLELVLREAPVAWQRRHDERTGLPLLVP